MSSSDKTPGYVAAWALSFWTEDKATHTVSGDPALTIGSSDFDADIDLTLPSGLSAGAFTKFSVYSLDDDRHKTIQACDVAKLYIYYADAGSYLSTLFGGLTGGSSAPPDPSTLVADLRITGVKKKKYEPPAAAAGAAGSSTAASPAAAAAAAPPGAPVAPIVVPNAPPAITALTAPAAGTPVVLTAGAPVPVTLRRYDYQFDFTFAQRIYHELASKRRQVGNPPAPATSAADAIKMLLETQLLLKAETHYHYYPVTESAATHIAFPPEPSIAAQIAILGQRHGVLERLNNVSGRGMLLIRDGVLYIGKRPIPMSTSSQPAQPIDLNYGAGLLDATKTGDASPPRGSADDPKHDQWTLTLRGRPDIKPGDVVRFQKPPEFTPRTPSSNGVISAIASMASMLGGVDEKPDTSMYVETVQHKLGRSSGFSTTLTGIEFGDQNESNAWDPLGKGTISKGAGSGPAVAATAVRAASDTTTASQTFPSVGEIRAFAIADQPASDDKHPGTAAQTSRVWTGLNSDLLDNGDTGANPARRADIDRDSYNVLDGIPYLTPFALGSCGLVLPRYPNTRVLLAYRKGDASDPVDIGALWQTGHVPANAAAGDWWLSLPAYDAGTNIPVSIEDTDTDGHDYDGKISQDLIDANGQRAIDVATLRIRAGADSLDKTGTKVTTAPSGTAIVIEHTKNGKTASITINDDASIEIKSDTKITFTSSEIDMNVVQNGNLNISAANVTVKVSGHMDVS